MNKCFYSLTIFFLIPRIRIIRKNASLKLFRTAWTLQNIHSNNLAKCIALLSQGYSSKEYCNAVLKKNVTKKSHPNSLSERLSARWTENASHHTLYTHDVAIREVCKAHIYTFSTRPQQNYFMHEADAQLTWTDTTSRQTHISFPSSYKPTISTSLLYQKAPFASHGCGGGGEVRSAKSTTKKQTHMRSHSVAL